MEDLVSAPRAGLCSGLGAGQSTDPPFPPTVESQAGWDFTPCQLCAQRVLDVSAQFLSTNLREKPRCLGRSRNFPSFPSPSLTTLPTLCLEETLGRLCAESRLQRRTEERSLLSLIHKCWCTESRYGPVRQPPSHPRGGRRCRC